MVIPLKDALKEHVSGGIGVLEVKILSSQNHSVDFVGLVTDITLEGNSDMVNIVPGEYIILTFEIPEQNPAPVFAVRDYMLFTRGYYRLYEEV